MTARGTREPHRRVTRAPARGAFDLVLEVRLADRTPPLTVGRIAQRGREMLFEYAATFLETGLALSPLGLPLRTGVQQETTGVFHGLHGLFHDSLPDGWGLRLTNRELARRGLDPATVSPLERLQFLGTRAMGGLTYRPVLDPDAPSASIDLGELADQSARLFEGSPETVLPTLARLGGSAAGARPKVLVAYDPVSCEMRSGTEDAPPNFHSYLVKFPNKEDGADIGRVEMAYAAMAREAGIDMPVTRLFNAGRKRHCFGVERFDRVWNFAFLMQPTGQWRLSPAYDLVYAPGPGGEHSMMIGTAASRPTFGNLLQVAAPEGLAPAEVSVIVDQVAQSVRRWRTHAGTFDVARATVATVDDAVARALACLR